MLTGIDLSNVLLFFSLVLFFIGIGCSIVAGVQYQFRAGKLIANPFDYNQAKENYSILVLFLF